MTEARAVSEADALINAALSSALLAVGSCRNYPDFDNDNPNEPRPFVRLCDNALALLKKAIDIRRDQALAGAGMGDGLERAAAISAYPRDWQDQSKQAQYEHGWNDCRKRFLRALIPEVAPECKECTGDGSACPYMGIEAPNDCLYRQVADGPFIPCPECCMEFACILNDRCANAGGAVQSNEGRQGSESLRGPSRESSAPESVADCPAVSSPINAAPQEKASVNLPELRGCLVSAGPTSREADEVPKVRLIADQAAVNSPAVAAPLALLRGELCT